MIHPMNFQMPTHEEIHATLAQGEAAVMAMYHTVATQVTAPAQRELKSISIFSPEFVRMVSLN
jgi:hypothetical protein